MQIKMSDRTRNEQLKEDVTEAQAKLKTYKIENDELRDMIRSDERKTLNRRNSSKQYA